MKQFFYAAITTLGLSACVTSQPVVESPVPPSFIQKLVAQGFSAAEIDDGLAKAQKRDDIIALMTKPAEAVKPWKDYAPIFLTEARLKNGLAFWHQYENELNRAEELYGVPAEYICAIIGVETNYARIMGKHRVLDALYTLGFHYEPRAAYFQGELEQFFLLAREQQWALEQPMGSYAGAMGMGQFMPTSYRKWALDFSGDGKVNLFQDVADSVGSVANYFVQHGWQKQGGLMLPVTVPSDVATIEPYPKSGIKTVAEWRQLGVQIPAALSGHYNTSLLAFEEADGRHYYLGFNNFSVITKYNRSPMYARAVMEFAEQLRSTFENTPRTFSVAKE